MPLRALRGCSWCLRSAALLRRNTLRTHSVSSPRPRSFSSEAWFLQADASRALAIQQVRPIGAAGCHCNDACVFACVHVCLCAAALYGVCGVHNSSASACVCVRALSVVFRQCERLRELVTPGPGQAVSAYTNAPSNAAAVVAHSAIESDRHALELNARMTEMFARTQTSGINPQARARAHAQIYPANATRNHIHRPPHYLTATNLYRQLEAGTSGLLRKRHLYRLIY